MNTYYKEDTVLGQLGEHSHVEFSITEGASQGKLQGQQRAPAKDLVKRDVMSLGRQTISMTRWVVRTGTLDIVLKAEWNLSRPVVPKLPEECFKKKNKTDS